MFNFIRQGTWAWEEYWREFKYFLERVFRGYDRTALWSLDSYLLRHNFKAIKAFMESDPMGHPCTLIDGKPMTSEQWDEIRAKVLYSFDYVKNDKEFAWDKYTPEVAKRLKEEGEKVDEGFRLFGEYFQHFWS